MSQVPVTCVVMAGGRGERLWPLVRASTPKVCLAPEGHRSLLQAAIARLRRAVPSAEWLIVTTKEQAAYVRRQLSPSMRRSLVVEPDVKNTAACITLAAGLIARQDPRRVLVIAPADHWIRNVRAFGQAIRAAVQAAVRTEAIATIGIRPTAPETGFGYLCAGQPLLGFRGARVFRLRRFLEKPAARVARRLFADRRTYWNSGLFIARAGTILQCLSAWLPNHPRHVAPAIDGRRRATSRRLAVAYRMLDPISFDHGVMNHLRTGVIVEGRFDWCDLGSWTSWVRCAPSASRVVSLNSRNVQVVAEERHLVATLGVEDLVIVQTPSATLVARADDAQAVRRIVRRLSREPRLAAYR